MKLKNNTVLITGGTAGIGLAFAEEFYKLDNKVIICGRREDRLKKLSEKFPGIITKVSDVSNEKSRLELAEWAITNYPDLNILFNNAGIMILNDMMKPEESDKIYSQIETNLTAPMHLSTLFSNHLKDKDNSAIINITSGLAFVPMAIFPVYCATKAGLHSFTMSLRYQLRQTKTKVFEIAPPQVDTELGYQNRADVNQTNGGIPVKDFLSEAMEALKNDLLEAPIAFAKDLRAMSDKMFEKLNP